MVKKAKAVVRIGGREYTIRALESEEYIHRVAIYVNRKFEEITIAQPSLSMAMAAVLTAINLGDEVLKLKKELETLQKRVIELEEEVTKPEKPNVPSNASNTTPYIYDVTRREKR